VCGARIRWGGSMGSRPNGCSCASWTLHSDPSNNCTSVQFAPCSDARFWFVPWCVCLGTGARPDNSPKTLITQFLQYKPSRHTTPCSASHACCWPRPWRRAGPRPSSSPRSRARPWSRSVSQHLYRLGGDGDVIGFQGSFRWLMASPSHPIRLRLLWLCGER
jgi:hypothetical protein